MDFNVGNYHNMRCQQLIFISFCLIISSLAGCGSTPKKIVPVQSNQTPEVVPVVVNKTKTPDQLLAEAKQIWQESSNKVARNRLLLKAARGYLEQNDNNQAAQILLALRDEMSLRELRSEYQLLVANLYSKDTNVSSEQLLALLQPIANDPDIKQQQYELIAQQYVRQGQWLLAANALLQANNSQPEYVTQAWQWVKLAQSHAAGVTKQQQPAKHSLIEPYIMLGELIQQYGRDNDQLKQELKQFRKLYLGHPLVTHWPQELALAETLEDTPIYHVVAMLPLSGRLEASGQAIKDGILAAYYAQFNHSDSQLVPELTFVDTASTPIDIMVDQAQKANWVIGPLLKETVEALSTRLPLSAKMLALNRIEVPLENELATLNTLNQAFFALAPEDEARQLAEYMFGQGFHAPIIIASENSIYQRMLETFSNRWQQLSAGLSDSEKGQLTSVNFEDSNSLKEGITQALDVAQSRQRIKEIENLAEVQIYNLPRNRRDIDAIVTFASPEQTELLNPMIEASLSPIDGQMVPVFATSRAIDYEKSRNQWRDLENIHFLDMPWLLPNNQWQQMHADIAQLWPQRPTQLQRLFAFGVDAYNLLPVVDNLLALPQLSVSGLTGNLAVNDQGQVIRTLPHAMITQEQVKLIGE
jgi:outer membrane PBP1 activator LpoA protein